jgi:hypothetical protein
VSVDLEVAEDNVLETFAMMPKRMRDKVLNALRNCGVGNMTSIEFGHYMRFKAALEQLAEALDEDNKRAAVALLGARLEDG